MILQEKRNLTFYLLLAGTLLFLFLVRGILWPFVFGIILAFISKNILRSAERRGYNRKILALLLTTAYFIIIFLLVFLVLPLGVKQVVNLIKELMQYVDNKDFLDDLTSHLVKFKFFGIKNNNDFIEGASNLSRYILKYLGNISNYLLTYSLKLINIISMLFITPIATYYFLRDWEVIIKQIKASVPKNNKKYVLKLFKKINTTLEAYICGQALVCLILGIYYAVLLWLCNIKFGFIVGIISGIITFLPYIGPFSGGIVGVIITCYQYNFNIHKILLVVLIYISGQVLESNFITPKLIGSKVKLHPLFIIFSILCGGSLFGFTGMLFALPAAGVIGTTIRYLTRTTSTKHVNG